MMRNPSEIKHVCIHGHFYQPPRENPWLEEIEREDSAAPHHDWNERINAECYRANAAARVVDEKNRILNLYNNYGRLNFNFGPTLLNWLENHDPWVYRTILDADRESAARFDGHGNAIAQAYNHIIMPLANRRDKLTQVLWGIRDFSRRFGRRPEGMWLPETAVDRETLAIMADAGIKFTILSPFQAARWRFIGSGSDWTDASNGKIPTGRAYRCLCGRGKHIHLFFFDAAISRGIAFEQLLGHSSSLLSRIHAAFADRDRKPGEPWLVHTATDGESYGHHFKFGDMALAAAFEKMDQDPSTQIVNYATFLASFPVRAEVEIIENTAWSCAHGVGRWERDCGCHIGGGPGWHQRWRGPLRKALDQLRDTLARHYERQMQPLCPDPWKARDEYVDAYLDQEHLLETFIERHMRLSSDFSSIHRFLQLLEMQRHAMFMYTSCGWFFDDISGLESVLILRHAARAIHLAEKTGAASPEAAFLRTLEQAHSNLPEHGNGANIYLNTVKPGILRKGRIAANYAIQSLAGSPRRRFSFYGCDVLPQQEEDLGRSPVPCRFGHVKVKAGRTLEEEDFLYAVLHFGGLDFRCSVKRYEDDSEFKSILKALQQAVEGHHTVPMVRILDERFGADYYSLHDVSRDLRTSIALQVSRKTFASFVELQRTLYQAHQPLLTSLRQWGIRIPADLRVAVRRVLTDEVKDLIRAIIKAENDASREEYDWQATDFSFRAHVSHLQSLIQDAKSWGTSLQLEAASIDLGGALVEAFELLDRRPSSRAAGRAVRLLDVCRVLGVTPEWWKLQTLYFSMVRRGLTDPDWFAELLNARKFCGELDKRLGCRFGEFLDALPESLSREIVPLVTTKAVSRVP
ncbi:MAG TPA: DUF3536 domain-containing protein [Syntrophobacter fumaroxidans]|nr:DUF3536 domain-containing protein [Syntrophobacter fumaroxidans]